VPAGTRRFFWELFFAPFVSKKSGVPNYALQNRCKPTEIKLSKPLVHFFFLKPKAQKEKVRKKKNAVLGSFARCDERQGLCSLDSHPLAWGLLWVRCEHTPPPVNYNLCGFLAKKTKKSWTPYLQVQKNVVNYK